MRGFFTVILFTVFIFTFPLAIFTFWVNSVLNPSYIKKDLVDSKIYSVAAKNLPQSISGPTGENQEQLVPDEYEAEFKKFIEKEVTAPYLQQKVEPFIDDVFTWLVGKTEETPQISLADLSTKLENLPVGRLLPPEIDNVINRPIKFEPKERYQFRSWYQTLNMLPIIMTIVSVISLLLILLLAKGWRSKLRRASLVLFITTIFGFLSVVVVVGLGSLMGGMLSGFFDTPEFKDFSEPVKHLVSQFPLDLSIRLAITYLGTIVTSLLLFIISFFFDRKGKEAPATAQTEANSKK
ncbi:MAG: hypothetical protein A2Z11_00310 [Candidatus Woykebacteria bacterium RBG_16_43_9]|uniref:Uncharacterized protein n=1 Tax=Candidatus Woykebacteria bacterium RBG_16_43_9 TaxID=1802596 RepID=A0A1G1WG82_9BACT|nr:MAG: hypothetical protein A2Z11_00310 [Candidatus Woykebacteria bacterium RBG_16_43_9]